MNQMGLLKLNCDEVMNMSRKALKARLVAHEAMYVNQQHSAAAIPSGLGGHQ